MPAAERIAIVGLAARLPGSGADLGRFWANVAGALDCSESVPDGRWLLPPSDCLDPRPAQPDSVYSDRGYFLDSFEPELAGLAVSAEFVAELDVLFPLVLDVGGRAFHSCRFGGVDRRRAGVILGNICLPTEKASDLAREYLGKSRRKTAPDFDPPTHPLNRHAAGLPAGLLAKALGFGGTAFTLDAACATSIYAVKLACDELLAGRADLMLAGGASRPDALYTQMGFSQLRALSLSGSCSPFDARADGLLVGEGAGVFVLKRLTDAVRHGDDIWGIIAGVGLSNDTHGNLLAPAKEGQLRAMRSAYEQAGWKPTAADVIECHATGTPVGDAVEFDSLRTLWGDDGWKPGQCAIGSVKSTVGHLLTGAGAAALAKILLAMREGMKPPQANFRAAGPAIERYENGPFRILGEPEIWDPRRPTSPRRAAVSGFGFGGVNGHLLVENYVGQTFGGNSSLRLPARSERLPQSESVPAAPPSRILAKLNALIAKSPGANLTPVAATNLARPAPPEEAPLIAIVGVAAHIGPLPDARHFQEAALRPAGAIQPQPISAGWGRAWRTPPAGFGLDSVLVPVDRFRTPPKELAEALPQQLLMLNAAATAIDDCQGDAPGVGAGGADLRTGVFIGLSLDPNTTNFHLRWAAKSRGANPDAVGPPLTADRTMGALASVAASRIARAFHFGGPCFTVSNEGGGGLRALSLAVDALRNQELDRAVVGGVELACDPRAVLSREALSSGATPADGAGALVLKRLADARADGDRVYAIVRGVGSAVGGAAEAAHPDAAAHGSSLVRALTDAAVNPATVTHLEVAFDGSPGDATEADALAAFLANRGPACPVTVSALARQVGSPGAAGGLLALVKAAQALYQQVLPAGVPRGDLPEWLAPHQSLAAGAPRFWLADAADGPRRSAVAASGCDGVALHAILEEDVPPPESQHSIRERVEAERAQPLGARPEAAFAIEADSLAELDRAAAKLAARAQQLPTTPVEQLARQWFLSAGAKPMAKHALTLVARSPAELAEQLAFAREAIRNNPGDAIPDPGAKESRPALRDRVFYAPNPLGVKARVALVFPGSGNQFAGMGRALGVEFPGVLRRQQRENRQLRDQFQPELFWGDDIPEAATERDFLFGQVALGTLSADALTSLGVPADAMIGLSLGESAGLFGTRVWRDRDEMLKRVQSSTLFRHDLAPPYQSARTCYGLGDDAAVDWVAAVLAAPPERVRAALKPGGRAYLLIALTPAECVVGGLRADVTELAAQFPGAPFLLLEGVTIAHCEAGEPVAEKYRELHTLPVSAVPGLTVYSGADAEPYQPTPGHCADSITAGLTGPIDFPALVNRAYADGVRVFVEVGPGMSASRAVAAALGDRPYLARAVCVPRHADTSLVLKLMANLVAERTRVTLAALYSEPVIVATPPPAGGKRLTVAVGLPAPPVSTPDLQLQTEQPPAVEVPPVSEPEIVEVQAEPRPKLAALLAGPDDDADLDLIARSLNEVIDVAGVERDKPTAVVPAPTRRAVSALLGDDDDDDTVADEVEPAGVPRALSTEQCFTFARGKVGDVLGPRFAPIDEFPTRVRLPDGPLMLVDHVQLIEGEPLSMTSGRVVTDHAVRADRWYLDSGRCPVSVTVESGQADLFLAGFLGIDFQTKGRAVYRLLDAVVTFHRELPRIGETILYDIHVDEFFRQGESWLFRFRFEGSIDGQPLLSMQHGVAGFFTSEALAAGQGIVHTKFDKLKIDGKLPDDWPRLAPIETTSLTEEQVEAVRAGDLATAFGPDFARFVNPQRLPGGMLRLLDRVPLLDPAGGRFGLGFVRGEYDIRPAEWFIECHFVDDKVMPGTLMYECCLHTLRVLLMRMGWVGTEGGAACDPVPGVQSRLKCRGQVLQSTRTVTYEITLKETGANPEPFAIADALMLADGRPIVEITNLSLKLTGVTLSDLAAIWTTADAAPNLPDPAARAAFPKDKILAYSSGDPSEAFGEPYKVFDRERVLARLPRPPYQFLDRVSSVTGEPFVLKSGAACVAEYDVPRDAWYFAANRSKLMPFSVLLEVALQPCGFLAAYCGSALTSDVDLSFRNLGGQATQHRAVTADTGMLTTAVTLTKTANAGGMIIQHYDLNVWDDRGAVTTGATYFGFFTKGALANQVGTPGAKLAAPTESDKKSLGYRDVALPDAAPFPAPRYRMIDRVEYAPEGGERGLGVAVGTIKVDPNAWFFEAHFYQDPVWPGSLGLESFLQLLKFVAAEKYGPRDFQTVALGEQHSWEYRGQVLPSDTEVRVHLEVTEEDAARRKLTARGFLVVDGRIIYKLVDFTLE